MLNNNGVNKIFLLGQIVTEPIKKNIEGTETWTFDLVTREQISSNGKFIEHAETHHIHVAANITELLTAGDLLHIEGRLQTFISIDIMRVKRYDTHIVVNRLVVVNY